MATCLLLCAAASPAAADPPSPASETADSLFWEGRRAADAGDFATACEKFAASLALERLAGAVFNLAHCEEKLGRVASAWRHYNEAVARMKDDDGRAAFARERIAALEPRLPRLTIRVEGPHPAGLRVTRDGELLAAAALGAAEPVDPGSHSVRVTADGRAPREVEVTIDEGRTLDLEVAPGPELAPPPPLRPTAPRATAPLPDRPPLSAQRTAGWTLIGVGGAGAVLGAIAGGMVLREKALFDSHCPDAACRDQAGMDAASRGIAWGTTADAAFVTGGVAAAVGLILLLAPDASSQASRASAGRSFSLTTLSW